MNMMIIDLPKEVFEVSLESIAKVIPPVAPSNKKELNIAIPGDYFELLDKEEKRNKSWILKKDLMVSPTEGRKKLEEAIANSGFEIVNIVRKAENEDFQPNPPVFQFQKNWRGKIEMRRK